jgi:hypothetical protein
MLDAATERRMKREHFEKYRDLARALGLEELSALVPASRERIERALASGDEHLNTISLASWDKAAGAETKLGPDWARRDPTKPCPTCGHKGPAPLKKRTVGTFPDRLSIEGVWARSFRPYTVKGKRMRGYLSLAERVCVLKWVARYHVAGDAEPGGGDE